MPFGSVCPTIHHNLRLPGLVLAGAANPHNTRLFHVEHLHSTLNRICLVLLVSVIRSLCSSAYHFSFRLLSRSRVSFLAVLIVYKWPKMQGNTPIPYLPFGRVWPAVESCINLLVSFAATRPPFPSPAYLIYLFVLSGPV